MPCLIASVAKNLDGVLLFFDVVYSSFKFLLYVCLGLHTKAQLVVSNVYWCVKNMPISLEY